jgi:hypothetical protein
MRLGTYIIAASELMYSFYLAMSNIMPFHDLAFGRGGLAHEGSDLALLRIRLDGPLEGM